jgi:CheY-like chemotaxis protein
MSHQASIRVVVVDDSEVFREFLIGQIAQTPGFDLAAAAASGEQAVEMVEAARPDMVLIDVRMPGMGGLEAARLIHEAHPGIVLVMMSVDLASLALDGDGPTTRLPRVEKRVLRASTLATLWNAHKPT